MKILAKSLLLSTVVICTACPPRKYTNDLTKIQNNNMDLPDPERNYFEGITYQLSNLFVEDYDEEYVISNVAETKVIYDVDLNFSVEVFEKVDAETMQYSFDDEIDLLNAVHDHYIIRRQKSLFESKVSIKKPLPEEIGYNGLIQVVEGGQYEYDGSSYFTATLEISDRYFVFQLIGVKENMGYLYDDFIDILASVQG